MSCCYLRVQAYAGGNGEVFNTWVCEIWTSISGFIEDLLTSVQNNKYFRFFKKIILKSYSVKCIMSCCYWRVQAYAGGNGEVFNTWVCEIWTSISGFIEDLLTSIVKYRFFALVFWWFHLPVLVRVLICYRVHPNTHSMFRHIYSTRKYIQYLVM